MAVVAFLANPNVLSESHARASVSRAERLCHRATFHRAGLCFRALHSGTRHDLPISYSLAAFARSSFVNSSVFRWIGPNFPILRSRPIMFSSPKCELCSNCGS